jgi:putative ABC transport system permease protein
MSLWRQLTHGLRVLTRVRAADRELDEEIRHFEEEAAADYRGRGMSPEAAAHAARLEVGSRLAVREDVRAAAWEHVVTTALGDARYAIRRLRSSPTFMLVSVVTLALGIGAATTIFSAVNPILLAPLPYPGAARILTIQDQRVDAAPFDVTFGTFREVAARTRGFEALAVWKPWQPTLTGDGPPERLAGQRVSGGYLRVLGAAPMAGRDLVTADDMVNGPNVVVIGHGLWLRRFGADPAIVGRSLMLDGVLFTIVGVMSRTFENVLMPESEIWSPLQYDQSLPANGREWGHHLRMIGRMHGGTSIEAARGELDAIASARVAEFERPPWALLERGFVVERLQDDVTRSVRPALLAVLGAVLLLLVITAVNVTTLVLARGSERQAEFVMRRALGATGWRIVCQLLTENLILAGVGGTAAVLVATVGVRALAALGPSGLPRVHAIVIDGPVLAFAVAVSTLVAVAMGVAPASHAWRTLRSGPRASFTRVAAGHSATRRVLVMAEIGLALVLLVGAGLLMRSLQRLFAVSPGFEPMGVLTLQVQVSGRLYDDDQAVRRFFDRALDAVREVPGVASAGWTSQLPLSRDDDRYGVQFESSTAADKRDDQGVFRYAVSPGYFETLRIPLRQGRPLDRRETRHEAPVGVVISESLARRRFPNASAIGQRLHLGRTDLPWYSVVGVVGDAVVCNRSRLVPRRARLRRSGRSRRVRARRHLEHRREPAGRPRGDSGSSRLAVRCRTALRDGDVPVLRRRCPDTRRNGHLRCRVGISRGAHARDWHSRGTRCVARRCRWAVRRRRPEDDGCRYGARTPDRGVGKSGARCSPFRRIATRSSNVPGRGRRDCGCVARCLRGSRLTCGQS